MAEKEGRAPIDPGATADFGPPEFNDPPVSNWDRYEITNLLGTGGMAQVFKAFDPQLKRFVALKFIRGEDASLRERLLKEARAQAQLDHPHICKIYEVGEVQNRHFIAMQFIDGYTLDRIQPELLLEQKIKILQQVAEAVHVAHRMGIIHRDLKPTNIMVENTQDGGVLHPYVMDFGIAREIGLPSNTATDQLVGTPSYMAPEQVFGDRMQLDRRTDIYCLGSTLYFLLTGRSPFEGSALEVLMKVSRETPVRLTKLIPGIPRDIETIVMKCIEKEPWRRYDSAKALSDDLQRYLNGEPIAARPPSLAYKVEKKFKKNKILSFLILILLMAGVLAIYWRWRTAEQLRLTQEFAQAVEAMDWMMRVAHMTPLHDIRQEKKQIRKRMEILEVNMKQSGSLALGPGHYALGKGFMALQNYQEAKKHLEEAWKNNYRTPETAYALGETMGALYQMELQRAEQIESELLRGQRKKQIEDKFREPALQYLKASSGVRTEAPEYLEALIAFYDKDYGLALEKTQKAFHRVPWFYEAKILESKIYQIYGSEKLDKGDLGAAQKDLLQSELSYRKALQIGQSDLQGYRGICVIRSELFYSEFYGEGKDLETLKAKALEACNRALLTDPDDPFTLNKLSFLLSLWAEHQINLGQNPSDSIRSSLEAADRAIQLEPQGVEGHNNRGMAFWLKAKQETATGKDADPSFQLAVKSLSHANKMDPNDTGTLNHLGLAYMDLGDFRMYHGKDPRSSYEEATKLFRKTIQINPDYFVGYANLGILYSAIGEYEMDHGYDPVSSLTMAAEILNRAKGISPTNIFCYRWLLYVHRDLGEHQSRLGQDSSAELKLAEHFFESGKRIQKEDAFLYREAATIFLIRAEMDLIRKASPAANLQRAHEILVLALKYNPADAATHSRVGDAHLLEARWFIFNGKSPESSLQHARSSFQQAIQLNPDEASASTGLAEQFYWLAKFRKSSSIEEGLNKIDEALLVNPASAEAYGCKGMLLSLKDPAAAEQAFLKALSLNRHLRNRYKAYQSQS
jgi:eukaryotic-like serine/threonine-protein kinase